MNEKTGKKIMKMHKKGMTTYAIAKQLGLSQTGVKYVLDPKYREHMKQISRKRYQPKSSQPNNTIPSSDIAWLSKHRQSIEKSSRILKGAGVFFYSFVLTFAITAFFILITNSFALIFVAVALLIALFLTSAITTNKYIKEMLIGSLSGFIVGIAITLIYIAPIVSVMQYPITMQVFYPNHPNMTITQNCTGFTTSESGYFNGQPINPQNTTQCNLPQNMAPYGSNPFSCNIMNKSIICTGTFPGQFPGQNVTWQGTILNVSKR